MTRPTFKDPPKPALPDPMDRFWGLCPKCKQSAQASFAGRLICYRCNLTFPPPAKEG